MSRRRVWVILSLSLAGMMGVGACGFLGGGTAAPPGEAPVVQAEVTTPEGAAGESAPAESAPPESAPSESPPPESASPGGGDGVSVDSAPGTISGALAYPSESIPALQVYALRTDGQRWLFVNTQPDQPSYTLQVEPGDYHIVAYAMDGAVSGAYTGYAACLATADDPATCDGDDHALVAVSVGPGETLSGIDVLDWYAPPGTFPPRP